MAKKRKKKTITSKTKKGKKDKSRKRAKNTFKLVIISLIIIIAAIVLIILFYPQQQKTAAIVNGKIITEDYLNKRMELFKFQIGFEDISISEKDMLKQMIDEQLLLLEAEKKGISADKDEAKALVELSIENSFMTKDSFEKILKANGLSLSDLVVYYENRLTGAALLDHVLPTNIEVTEQEIKEYYDNNLDLFSTNSGEMRARHILVQSEQAAEDILNKLNSGKDFAELAAKYSKCPSASKGGELGFFSRGQMVSEFEDAAFSLRVNELSRPVQTEFGWHVIQREPNTVYLSEAIESISGKLLLEKQKEQVTIYIDGLKETADIFNYLEESEEKIVTIIEE
ncbi:peptidylprolyl isomerase [Candidatus Woesearchaeota archaeon]|nr:peptidylprolyl isomerase [Candidatus Woesearchaeota archaeon]